MHILTLPLMRSEDILAVRAASRAVARELGLDDAGQVRLATALSEVGREVLVESRDGDVQFDVSDPPDPAITITFTARCPVPGRALDAASGIEAARRLVDVVDVRVGEAQQVVAVIRQLATRSSLPDAAELTRAVRAAVPPTPLEELWNQNRHLASTLDQLLAKQEETLRLNLELEETNRGVMAMYAQLSEELEDTNRGVVALYAELDDKSIQLEEAGQAKSRFFAAVSHELRSPVNSIVGLARVMREEDDPLTDDQRHELGLIESAATGLSGLVNQLLDIAKAEAGRLEPDVRSVDLAELASELRGSLRPLVDTRLVELVTDVDEDVPEIETDETLLAQILRNLLVNAVKYTEAGEIRLTVTLDDNAQQVRCTVSDTGIGIDPAHLERIFEEFFQVRSAMQAKTRGTGLGLAHSRRLAQVLAAELTVESEVGRGSAFTLSIPVHWNAVIASEPTHLADGVTAHDTVLVIDDDEVFRTALRGMLQGSVDRVVEAPDAETAFALMTESVPDVVFLDLRMPDVDGDEVLAWMGAQPELKDVPVVIVTSVDLGIEVRARLTRAYALLSKAEITRERVAFVLAELERGATS